MFHTLGILHSLSPPIIHRDISFYNLLIKQKYRNGLLEIVVNDFDLALEIESEIVKLEHGEYAHTRGVGKVNYAAPEVTSGNYDTSIDIWSAGVVLFELMTLKSNQRLAAKIRNKHTETLQHEIMREQLKVSTLFDTHSVANRSVH